MSNVFMDILKNRIYDKRASAVLAAGILLSGSPSDEFGGKVKEEIFKVLGERQFNQTYQAAIIVLGQMGGQQAFSSLSNLYTRYSRDKKSKWGTSASSIARKMALIAMAEGKLEDDQVLPFLVRETWSADKDISRTAGYALHVLSCNRKGGACGSMIRDTVPVTSSMKFGKFQLYGLLQEWASHPSYDFSSEEMDYVKKYFRDGFLSEIDALVAKEKPSSSNFSRFEAVLASMVSQQGEPAWEPLTTFVPKQEAAAVRKVIADVYRERYGEFEKILEICYGSDLNTARSLIVPLIAFIPMTGHDRVPDIIVSIATDKPDSTDGLSAIKALAHYKQDESVEALRKAAESSNRVTRISIIESLAQIRTAGACSLLGAIHQKDPSSPVRQMALEAMEACAPAA